MSPGEASGAIAPAVMGKQEALAKFSVDLTEKARRGEIDPILGRDAEIRQVVDILELNIGYGQGNLFGEPRAIRDAVLAEADPPADFMRANLRRRAAR